MVSSRAQAGLRDIFVCAMPRVKHLQLLKWISGYSESTRNQRHLVLVSSQHPLKLTQKQPHVSTTEARSQKRKREEDEKKAVTEMEKKKADVEKLMGKVERGIIKETEKAEKKAKKQEEKLEKKKKQTQEKLGKQLSKPIKAKTQPRAKE
jgi:hypothetical protein